MGRAAVHISTDRYVRNYGKLPRGRGSWAFDLIDASSGETVDTVFAPTGTLTAARIWLRDCVRTNYAEQNATGFLHIEVGT